MAYSLSENELQKAEQEIGAVFPRSYRLAMMQSNGGIVQTIDDEWELFPIQGEFARQHISRTCYHVFNETRQAREWKTFQESAYAIGGNGTGDLLVMLRKDGEFEKEIFVWGHEDGSLTLVAHDFADLPVV